MLSDVSLKECIVKLIVRQNLPFTLVEAPEFIDLLKLCNSNVEKFLVKSDSLTQYLVKRFWEVRDSIKKVFSSVKAKVSFTCDLWTSPNQKAILAVTVHWVEEKSELKELLLDAMEMNGAHSGQNIASHIIKNFSDFDLKEKIFCITADNASNNRTMAQFLKTNIPEFDWSQNLLGCTGHVFNLAAQAGLAALGNESDENLISFENEKDSIVNLDEDGWGNIDEENVDDECDEANNSEFEPKTIVDRLRKIVKSVRCSPQKRKMFEETIKLSCPSLFVSPSVNPQLIQQQAADIIPSGTRVAPPRLASARAR